MLPELSPHPHCVPNRQTISPFTWRERDTGHFLLAESRQLSCFSLCGSAVNHHHLTTHTLHTALFPKDTTLRLLFPVLTVEPTPEVSPQRRSAARPLSSLWLPACLQVRISSSSIMRTWIGSYDDMSSLGLLTLISLRRLSCLDLAKASYHNLDVTLTLFPSSLTLASVLVVPIPLV